MLVVQTPQLKSPRIGAFLLNGDDKNLYFYTGLPIQTTMFLKPLINIWTDYCSFSTVDPNGSVVFISQAWGVMYLTKRYHKNVDFLTNFGIEIVSYK